MLYRNLHSSHNQLDYHILQNDIHLGDRFAMCGTRAQLHVYYLLFIICMFIIKKIYSIVFLINFLSYIVNFSEEKLVLIFSISLLHTHTLSFFLLFIRS